VFRSKQEVREYVWRKIEKFSKFPPPWGRIPNFIGAEKACEKIRSLEEYRRADVIFSAPDSPLKRLREIALEDGKILIAVKPKMKGFLLIKEGKAGTIKDMMRYGKEVRLDDLTVDVDLFVQGCVAVDLKGNRIGKGSGFGDKEYQLLKKKGILSEECKYVVVAHDLQVFDDLEYLMDPPDVRVDIVVTPSRVIRIERW